MPYTNYIDVFNEGRDADQPLVTLYDDESIHFFFDLLTASGEVYKHYFQAGNIAMVSFNVHQDLQIGTGYYTVKGGKVEVLNETGIMQNLLTRIHYEKVIQPQDVEDDTARERRYQDYLQQTLKQAAESGNQRQEAEVMLQYHQAMLEVALAIEPTGEDKGKIDLDAFKAKVQGLEQQRAWFARTPETFDHDTMQVLIAAVIRGLQDIQNLSAEAQAHIQRNIVTRFYDIRHPKEKQR